MRIPKSYTVKDAGEGWDLFAADLLPGEKMRMGFWGDSPAPGERLLGFVSVRANDPNIPFFAALDNLGRLFSNAEGDA